MDLNAKVKKSAICAGVSLVRSARFGSFSNKTIKNPTTGEPCDSGPPREQINDQQGSKCTNQSF